MNQGQKGIPFAQFKLYCMSGFEYTGDVESFGYVYWVKQRVPVDLPDDLSINTTMKRTYVTVSSLKVRRYPSSGIVYFGYNLTQEQQKSNKKAQSENELFRQMMVTLLTAVNTANSVYGSYKTYQSASTAPVILGAEYLRINKGGTLVRNANRVYTTEGKVAGKLANKLAFYGVLIDLTGTIVKSIDPNLSSYENKKNWFDFGTNTAVTVGIYIIGTLSPPIAAFLGVSYLVFSIFSEKPTGYIETDYVKIHGSIAPADNTKVHNPLRK